ncbi:sialidase family protein [Candidatus Latescibacterota bacterium]
MRHTVIYRKEGVYACFPTLSQGLDGRLHIRFATRVLASHIDPRGGHLSLVSTDEGETWQPADGEPVDPTWEDGCGTIIIPAANGWRYAPAKERESMEARGIEVRDVPDGSVAYAEGCVLRRSTDGGGTYVETPLETPPQALVMNFHDVASVVRYDERTIMRAVYGRPRPNVRFYEVWLMRSNDNGSTWEWLTLASDAAGQVGLGETSLLRTGEGDLLAMMRAEPVSQHPHLHLSRSHDGGQTWSPPSNTGISGHPPHLLRLSGGQIVCSYGFRQDPMGIRAVVSRDDGHTWSAPHVLRDDGQGRGGDLGYPVTVQLGDGTLFTVYYFTGADGVTHVAGSYWEL